MLSHMKVPILVTALVSPLSALARTGTIKDVEHVVLFMQENRAFDHYFGSMHGVRGFADPNVHVASTGREVWYQQVTPTQSNATKELLPFYVNAAGGNLSDATQCMTAASNGFLQNHNAVAHGDNNQWVIKQNAFAWGHFLRQDVPTHFALADGWTVADMYQEGVMASTHPNRAYWASGSVNVPGGPQTLDQGGVVIDNSETPGCEAPNLNCFPYNWKTYPEVLEEANVTWQLYQGVDNFGDNPLAYFKNFIDAPANSSLAEKGMSFNGLQAFYDAAGNGTLPQISYIIGPMELSEHPPWMPKDGAWLQQQVVNAVVNSPKYNSTVLLISYDETGGWGDHVLPITAPPNTPGEWMVNPFNTSETVFAGPGLRLPFTAISPWSRGGHVFTAHSDHSSQIMFLEKWLAAKGKRAVTDQLNSWRREHMSDLTQMFDFAHPDYSIPEMPIPPPPIVNAKGQFMGTQTCQADFPNPQPPIPYGNQTRQNSLQIETGFKNVRGSLTEGRYLVFEDAKHALSLSSHGDGLTTSPAVNSHDTPLQRFVLHATADPPATTFKLQFKGKTGGYLGHGLRSTSSAAKALVFDIKDLGSGKGYTLQDTSSHQYLSISKNGKDVTLGREKGTFTVYSVTKSSDSGHGF